MPYLSTHLARAIQPYLSTHLHGYHTHSQFGFDGLEEAAQQQQHRRHSLRSTTKVATFDDAVLSVARHDFTMDGTLDIIVGTADGHVVALTEQVWRACHRHHHHHHHDHHHHHRHL